MIITLWLCEAVFILVYISIVYILISMLRTARFSIGQWQFIFNLYFSNQIKFDLKSINQEFLLFLKSLSKCSIQYFVIVPSL